MLSNYVLITGGSDGIGLELAKLFAKDKHNLVLAARNIEKLNKAKEMLKGEGIDVRIISVDLSSMEECEKLIKYIEDNKLMPISSLYTINIKEAKTKEEMENFHADAYISISPNIL